jgi:uncharacterized protein (TIGR00369 family)
VSPNDEIVRQAIAGSPLARLLAMDVVALERDRARIQLPFRSEVTTVGDLVHGGAISALVDVAATAAVWTAADMARNPRGTTIGFSLNFLAPARGQDLTADARVVQRGRTICVCDVQVEDAGHRAVARALVTYKLDHT